MVELILVSPPIDQDKSTQGGPHEQSQNLDND